MPCRNQNGSILSIFTTLYCIWNYGYILLFSLKFSNHHLSAVICSLLIGLFKVYVPGINRTSIVNVYLEPIGCSVFKKYFLVFVTATTFTGSARHILFFNVLDISCLNKENPCKLTRYRRPLAHEKYTPKTSTDSR